MGFFCVRKDGKLQFYCSTVIPVLQILLFKMYPFCTMEHRVLINTKPKQSRSHKPGVCPHILGSLGQGTGLALSSLHIIVNLKYADLTIVILTFLISI